MIRPTTTPSLLSRFGSVIVLVTACLLVLVTYGLLMDLKGISTDEGIRLAIINGGAPFTPEQDYGEATWEKVLETNAPVAYQPLYFLLQNSLMRLFGTHEANFFRLINIGFLGLCLAGLLALSRSWNLGPRLFLLGLFAGNAYLLMHVLQIREYIAGVAFYIWSTWWVLRLDARRLEKPWADTGWFALYGVLLALAFYLQSWIVFPAIGQALFLILRRRVEYLRFIAHLALSYVIVVAVTLPYLQSHRQKVDVGLWAHENVNLWGQLHQGFHLVLSGHLPGHDWFTFLLPWVWLALIAVGGWLLIRQRRSQDSAAAGDLRQGWLMILCIVCPLIFQIAYFLKVEPLSVWPRYFIIHYFFVTWLIALGFRSLHRSRHTSGFRRPARAGLGALGLLLVASAVYQIRSYQGDPYFDTSLSRISDWRIGTRLLANVLTPEDVILCQDYVTRSTLTFTHPFPNQLLLFTDLETTDLGHVKRVVYLEADYLQPARGDLANRLAAHGFAGPVELPASEGEPNVSPPFWRVIAFSHP